jgi:hypothetical protein
MDHRNNRAPSTDEARNRDITTKSYDDLCPERGRTMATAPDSKFPGVNFSDSTRGNVVTSFRRGIGVLRLRWIGQPSA